MKKRWIILLLVSAMALGCVGKTIEVENAIPTEKIADSTLYVKKVENLPDGFIIR